MNLKLNIKKKIIILIVVFATILSGVALFVSSRTITKMVDESYQNRTDEIAATVARVIDADAAEKLTKELMSVYYSIDEKVGSEEWGTPEFDAYIAKYEHLRDTDEFKLLLNQLRSLQEVNSVDCIYLINVEFDNKQVIYVVDAALEDECPPGCFDPLYEMNYGIIEDHDIGFPAYITNTEEYGWLVTSAAPVYNGKGDLVCYAAVDVSMDDIRKEQQDFIASLAIALILMTVAICVITIRIIDGSLVKPLNLLSEAALKYRNSKSKQKASFDEIEIKTGDEIETLHRSMVQMERDIDNYIENLDKTRKQLTSTKQEAEEMNELAHKDSLTGIRNKLAYDQEDEKLRKELKEGKNEFGIAIVDLNDLKSINDNYGHDCGNISIVKIAQIICEVFLHSPVFRIGGDEFAVILKNNDYDKIDSLIEEFNQRLKALEQEDIEPWEKVGASIGYALYDPTLDNSVDDVFRRADQDMYQKKKEMKKGR